MSETRADPLRPSRRDLLLGGLTLGAGAIALARMPRKTLTLIGPRQLDNIVPLHIGGWEFESSSGLVLPPPDQLAKVLYDQQVSRVYSRPDGLPVMLVMAYGTSQSGMLQVHRPEVCYPAAGFRLSDTVVTSLPVGGGHVIPVRSFTGRSDTRVEQVLYWTRIGNYLPVSWTMQRFAVMRSNLHGLIPDGLLFRISTVTNDVAEGQAVLHRFVQEMLAAASPRERRLLIGNAV